MQHTTLYDNEMKILCVPNTNGNISTINVQSVIDQTPDRLPESESQAVSVKKKGRPACGIKRHKRAAHIRAEKKRRYSIKNSLLNLKNLVNFLVDDKEVHSFVDVVLRSVQVIRYLRKLPCQLPQEQFISTHGCSEDDIDELLETLDSIQNQLASSSSQSPLDDGALDNSGLPDCVADFIMDYD